MVEPPDVPAQDDPQDGSTSGPLARFFGFVFIAGMLALGAIVLYRIYPAHIHEKANPGFIDNIFDSGLVVFAARLVLLSAALVLAFAGAHIVVSIVSWVKHKQWLTKFGPFEVSREAIEQLQGLAQFWQEQALQQANEVQQLQQQLQETNQLLELFLGDQPEEGLDDDSGTDNLGDAHEPDEP